MNTTGLLATILALSAAIAAADSTVSTHKPDTTENAEPEQGLQYVNPGEEICLQTDRKFSILLSSNPTTGFRWRLAAPPNPKIVTLATNEYIPPASTTIGAGGNEKWTFRAIGRGKTSISFIYTRPWEKDAEPAGRATFIVNVR